MNSITKITIALILIAGFVLLVSPASATLADVDSPPIVPTNVYLTTAQIRAGEDTGFGVSLDFIGENERVAYFSHNTYLGRMYELKDSHNQQDIIAFKSYVCGIKALAPKCLANYRARMNEVGKE